MEEYISKEVRIQNINEDRLHPFLMNNLLEQAREDVKLGDRIRIYTNDGERSWKKAYEGYVVYKNRWYFVMRTEKYDTAFTWTDYLLGRSDKCNSEH